jgi:Protein phosphatase 2A regulatory B subunit (B56 family)
MVYNAMKLFMEINPQLFDDCSHDYTELQNSAEKREQSRQSKWDRLAEQANKMKGGLDAPVVKTAHAKQETDSMTQDSQQRLDALKLHDEAAMGSKPSTVSGKPPFSQISLPLSFEPSPSSSSHALFRPLNLRPPFFSNLDLFLMCAVRLFARNDLAASPTLLRVTGGQRASQMA